MLVRDLNVHPVRQDHRRVEVIANGLPLGGRRGGGGRTTCAALLAARRARDSWPLEATLRHPRELLPSGCSRPVVRAFDVRRSVLLRRKPPVSTHRRRKC